MHKIISKVRFGLHPSFGVDYRDIKPQAEKRFEITHKGYGEFEIPVTIYGKRGIFE